MIENNGKFWKPMFRCKRELRKSLLCRLRNKYDYLQSSLVPNARAKKMSENIASVPDRVFESANRMSV